MTPEQRQQMERMQRGMADLGHLVTKLKPADDNPDAEVSLITIVEALAGAPVMGQLGESCDDGVLAKLEGALAAAGAFAADAFAACDKLTRRNCLLLYWHMHQPNMGEFAKELPSEVDVLRHRANQLATKLLIQAQMLMPQNRWVQPTLAVARASALISTALWSHTDQKAKQLMATILQEDQLPYPKLALACKCGPKTQSGDECLAGQQVLVTVELTRQHAAQPGVGERPPPNNPQVRST